MGYAPYMPDEHNFQNLIKRIRRWRKRGETDNLTAMHPKDYSYYLWHEECGRVAYFLRRRLEPGDPLSVDVLVYPDGTIPKGDEDFVCGACKQPMHKLEMKDSKTNEIVDIFRYMKGGEPTW